MQIESVFNLFSFRIRRVVLPTKGNKIIKEIRDVTKYSRVGELNWDKTRQFAAQAEPNIRVSQVKLRVSSQHIQDNIRSD